jgi:ADP-ribose pyrophosphatase
MKKPWKTLNSKVLFKNKYGYRLLEDDIEYDDGSKGKYNYLERKRGYVVIVPISKDGNVYLLKNWRYPLQKQIFELPMGYVDQEESPLMAAKRELDEELGIKKAKWIKLGYAWQAPGILKMKAHLFLAVNVEVGKREENEERYEIHSAKGNLLNIIEKMDLQESASITALVRAWRVIGKRKNKLQLGEEVAS